MLVRIYVVYMNVFRHIRTNIFGLRQGEFADAVGITQGAVSRLESGDPNPSYNTLISIRKAAASRGVAWDDSYFFDQSGEDVSLERKDSSA
ncbi:helix-turn-helix domain-containing protein [Rhizobium lusitanum]|uniref:Helix-turn-helix domain-containing protein n=1 Tax=Rhizobium lusitanum TaxID=293958 RepID=A0A6L9U539_9HYPH|nr:helix-turn-helix domain-containing protein [Rhizobium lusitanum]